MSGTYSNQRPTAPKFAKAAPTAAPRAASASATPGTKERKPTTHYLVRAGAEAGAQKELVRGIFITETKYGLQISVAEGLEQGLYFVNKRKPTSGTSNPYSAE